MKHVLLPTIIFVLLSFSSLTGKAQAKQAVSSNPACSSKGYWVVESNKHTPKEAIIYFYNNDNILVHKKEIRNQKLKLHKTATQLQLKTTLEDAISAYENGVAARQEKRRSPLVQN